MEAVVPPVVQAASDDQSIGMLVDRARSEGPQLPETGAVELVMAHALSGLDRGTEARACANDVVAVRGLLALHDEAARAGSTLVTGAGFGVLATEAVVAKLCEGVPAPHRVRVDAVASVAVEAGVFGAALAASIVDVLTAGGRRYANGRLTTSRLGADPQRLVFPDGESAKSAGVSSGELLAAHAVSGQGKWTPPAR